MADYNTVRVDQSGGVVTLTLNKPDKMNAMGPEMVAEMMSVFDALPGMEARALLITGEGRGFSSGADLSGRSLGGGGSKPGDASRRSLQTSFNPLMLALAGLDVPVVTAVNGAAAGIGCTLALSGDLIVAGKSAYFLQAFVNIGLVPDGGATWVLPKAAGIPAAMEAMLLGERIAAERAHELGMINRCVEDDAVMDEARALAERLANGPTVAMGQIRRLVRGAQSGSLSDAMNAEAEAQRIAGNSEDFVEGVQAFLGKREAQFKGR
ncbi:enoyl-CoA hydratase-related protein [Citromicrobium bathyomarinum]|uniref:enoyl-CoA hydratase-related protein n=1 Tax=Citromicrobium bathyomarinum TaxID=72174 RepID=UPI00315A2DAF